MRYSKFTQSGKPRTRADSHPYQRVIFWANPENWFWETDSHTPESKTYFRENLRTLLSQRHNALLIQDAQTWTGKGELR